LGLVQAVEAALTGQKFVDLLERINEAVFGGIEGFVLCFQDFTDLGGFGESLFAGGG